jgi:3,4-dihydroxy 2-butanone 4-phosphate synthase/GTP cyclohydrolase II
VDGLDHPAHQRLHLRADARPGGGPALPAAHGRRDPLRTAYTVSVDAAAGVSTGISAADRATTIRLLADPATTVTDLVRPGHVLPLRARPGGVLERPGHTEAAVDLCRLAGLAPVAAIGELVNDDGTMMRLPEVLATGETHDLPVVTIAQLVAWRQRHDRVERLAETTIPTRVGRFAAVGFRDRVTGDEHVALVSSSPAGHAPLVRLHSECLTGDAFGSLRCDCGPQLDRSLERIAHEGGVLVYLRGHEGRGVGLVSKLQAYALQDRGFDTVDAQLELDLPVDSREYAAGAAIVTELGLGPVRLLTNNPAKVAAMRGFGIEVVAVEGLSTAPTAANRDYLRTKRDRMGHDLVVDASFTGEPA